VPVNKLGSNAKSNLEMIDKLYASDKAVLIFPAACVAEKLVTPLPICPGAKALSARHKNIVTQ
jgi:hypothetical protein